MKIILRGDTLNISEINELSARTCDSFRSELQSYLPFGIKKIRVDLTNASFVDCRGLGSLASLHRKSQGRSVSLLNAPPSIRRIARLAHLEEILPCETCIVNPALQEVKMAMPITVSVSQPDIPTRSSTPQTIGPEQIPPLAPPAVQARGGTAAAANDISVIQA